jgi:CDP-4-dehydro-6-deoxyglucose reductase, E3
VKKIMAQVGTVDLINANVYQVTLKVEGVDFVAGQYLMIDLPTGESVPYSIGSAPQDLPELTLYILVSDETSLAFQVVEYLKNHTDIEVQIPGGDCHLETPLLTKAVDQVLLIAGGTGFSQMKSMFDALRQQSFTKPVTLYWGLRTPEDLFEANWLQQALTAQPNFRIEVVVNQANDTWVGRHGWLYEAIKEDHPDLTNSVAFISGSVGMVYGTLDQLETIGMTQAHCLSDVFAYAPRPKTPAL